MTPGPINPQSMTLQTPAISPPVEPKHKSKLWKIIGIVLVGIVTTFSLLAWYGFYLEQQDQHLSNNSQNNDVSTLVPEGVNPDNFREVTLDSRFEYYVKAEGKITFLSDRSSELTVVILPGTLRYEAQTLPINAENNMVYGNYGDYSYSFNAPLIPGVYNGVIVTRTNDKDGKRPENKNFKLTVINAIKNEAEAYTVAEHFLRIKISLPEHANVKNWTEQKKDIILTDVGWKVSLVFDYQSCGIEAKLSHWENDCALRQAKANLLVRTNGIIEEI